MVEFLPRICRTRLGQTEGRTEGRMGGRTMFGSLFRKSLSEFLRNNNEVIERQNKNVSKCHHRESLLRSVDATYYKK